MKVLLLQLDGKLPNLALMRIAHHHHERGDEVVLKKCGNRAALEQLEWLPSGDIHSPFKFSERFDKVYGSLIFESTRPLAERAMEIYPEIALGGTGWMISSTLADVGIQEGPIALGYQHYRPKFPAGRAIGFTQRGCRLACDFCVVPTKEGKPRHAQTIQEIVDDARAGLDAVRLSAGQRAHNSRSPGGIWPNELLLLDNDFFGGPQWIDRHAELVAGGFKVDLTQGINARALNGETALALSQLDYRGTNMRERRLYTAWDQIGHERPLMRGLELLAKAGVKPDHIMVYMLIGFKDSHEDRMHRRAQLRAFGARPYPMPFVRTPELVGFQRWVVGAYDKRIPWEKWAGAKYSPRRLGSRRVSLPLFPDEASA